MKPDYIGLYGERLGGFLNWLSDTTDFGDWHPNIRLEVIEKLDNAWLMHLAEVRAKNVELENELEKIGEHRKNYNDLVSVLKRILKV